MPTINCLGAPLFYERKGQGQVLLLLHGLGSSSEDWSEQITFFSRYFDVIAPDFPLHGLSLGDISQFSLPHCAKAIDALLSSLALEKVMVVGVSMGGMVGLEIAARYPSKVSRLAVVNALAECRPRQLKEWWMLLSRRFLLRFVSVKAISYLMGKQLLPSRAHNEKRKLAVKRWSKNDRKSYIAAFNAVVGWHALDKLPSVTCPVLFISSEFDYTSPSSKKALAAIFPDGEFAQIKNAHHLVPLECPDLFNATLTRWLR